MKWYQHARWAYYAIAWTALSVAVSYRLAQGAQMTWLTIISFVWLFSYCAVWTLTGVWKSLPHYVRFKLWGWRWKFVGRPLGWLAMMFAEAITHPDWYWDADDPDRAHEQLEEIPQIEELGYGESTTITVERLLRMPTHRYRVTRPSEDEEDAGAEMVFKRLAIPRKSRHT